MLGRQTDFLTACIELTRKQTDEPLVKKSASTAAQNTLQKLASYQGPGQVSRGAAELRPMVWSYDAPHCWHNATCR